MVARSPLAAFLGFDPDTDGDCTRLDERPAPEPLPDPQLAAPDPATWSDANVTLAEALASNPRAVLMAALRAIFDQVRPDKRGFMPHGGRYGQARLATCWALRELGYEHAREVAASGWVVGKRDDPHK